MLNEKRSDGEELIGDYFDDEGIEYEIEKKIEKLNDDKIPYRRADFYLPSYGVYVEFLGRWNIEESKRKYIEKMEVYKKNNIPCVYIYPDNLGILDFIFKRKLKRVLKKQNKTWKLIKLNLKIFMDISLGFIILLGAGVYFVEGLAWKIFLGSGLIYYIHLGIKKSFLKG